MRILQQDFNKGIAKVQIESPDDIWILEGLIEPGDHISASTERKIKLGGSEEKTRIIKKRVYLTIEAEKISSIEELRILGKIVDAPEDMPRGSSHSFTLKIGDDLKIKKKEWPQYQITRLKDATKIKHPVIILMFDREEAIFLQLVGKGVNELLKIKGDVNKKGLDESKQNTFYKELVKHIHEYNDRLKPKAIVAASPAFWQEYLKKIIDNNLKKKIIFTTISGVDKGAVKELVKRPELKNALEDARSAEELGFVEEIMTALAHDKLVYGLNEVIEALNLGNAKNIFITENEIKKLRESQQFKNIESLLRSAEKNQGVVHVLTNEDAMNKIDPLGGLVIIKRW